MLLKGRVWVYGFACVAPEGFEICKLERLLADFPTGYATGV